jgi:hypothetical protein
MRHVIFWGLLLGSLLTIPVSQAGAESEAPYLYYYDPQENALVIERADGTVYSEGIFPDLESIAHPLWSVAKADGSVVRYDISPSAYWLPEQAVERLR